MKIYYVYILKCSDDSFYTGFTNNIGRRLDEHNSGINKDCYTYSKRPVELMWCEMFTDPTQAIKVEKQIKGWSHRKKQALIGENWDKLIRFSKNYAQFGKDDETSTSSV